MIIVVALIILALLMFGIDGLHRRIRNLEIASSTKSGQIATLQSAVSTQSCSIGSNAADIADLKTRLAS
jgi:uncharacterized coiled-coil protein SlyX